MGCGDDAPAGTTDAASNDAVAGFCDGTPREIGQGIVHAIAVDASGRLLVVGTQFTQPQSLFVRRLLPSGEPDPTFGDAGLVTRPGAVTDGRAILPRADGTILVGAGIEDSGGDLKPLVYALSAEGHPTGFEVIDSASSSSVVEKIFEQGTSVIIASDGILRRITSGGTIANANITSVAGWAGHFTAGGTVSGGRAIVVCY